MFAIVWSKLDEDQPVNRPQRTPSPAVEKRQARALAWDFRPWLNFDTSERWRPLNVRAFMDEGRDESVAHEICPLRGSRDGCKPARGFADFVMRANGAGFSGQPYLDVHADGAAAKYRSPELDTCEHTDVVQECEHGGASAIYYRVTRAGDRYYIDYWWFLRYNDGGPRTWDHEGDWEGVTAVTQRGRQDRLEYVAFATHAERFRIAATQLEMHSSRRPVIYVAHGTHASYPLSCRNPCRQLIQLRGLVNLPERSIDGEESWARNDTDACKQPPDCLLALPSGGADPSLNWTIWSGHWGKDSGSPESPGRQSRYGNPECSRGAGGEECDGISAGCDAWVGATVRVAICLSREALTSSRTSHRVPPSIVVGSETVQGTTGAGVLQSLGRPPRPGGIRLTGLGARGTEVVVRVDLGRAQASYTEARFDGVEVLGDDPVELRLCKDSTAATLCLVARGGQELPAATQHTYTPPRRPRPP